MTVKLLREYLELDMYSNGLFDQTHQSFLDCQLAVDSHSCDV